MTSSQRVGKWFPHPVGVCCSLLEPHKVPYKVTNQCCPVYFLMNSGSTTPVDCMLKYRVHKENPEICKSGRLTVRWQPVHRVPAVRIVRMPPVVHTLPYTGVSRLNPFFQGTTPTAAAAELCSSPGGTIHRRRSSRGPHEPSCMMMHHHDSS